MFIVSASYSYFFLISPKLVSTGPLLHASLKLLTIQLQGHLWDSSSRPPSLCGVNMSSAVSKMYGIRYVSLHLSALLAVSLNSESLAPGTRPESRLISKKLCFLDFPQGLGFFTLRMEPGVRHWILMPPLRSRTRDFPQTLFPHLSNGDELQCTYLEELFWGSSQILDAKFLSQCLEYC